MFRLIFTAAFYDFVSRMAITNDVIGLQIINGHGHKLVAVTNIVALSYGGSFLSIASSFLEI